MLLSCPAMII